MLLLMIGKCINHHPVAYVLVGIDLEIQTKSTFPWPPLALGCNYYDIWFCGSWGSRLDPPPWFMIVAAPHNRVFHSIYYTMLLLIKPSSFCSTTLTYPLTTSLHGPYPSQYCPPPTAPTFINCTIFSYPAYLVSIIYSHKRPCPFLCLSESHARKSTGTL